LVNTTNKDNPFCFHCGKPLTQEPKQETLEEFIKSQPYYGTCTTEYKEGIELGAKWQAERMYSEEEVENILIEYVKTNPTKPYRVISWLQQFKKK
jgi:hypothetical protein